MSDDPIRNRRQNGAASDAGALRHRDAAAACPDAAGSGPDASAQFEDFEGGMLRENLASERTAASNANFGLTLLVCLVLAAIVCCGVWYLTTGPVSGQISATSPATPVHSSTVVAPA
jgi:hypothetical protein